MTYKHWTLVMEQEENGVAIDFYDPEGNYYQEPFCFSTLDETLNYGQICIDKLIQAKSQSLIQADT